MLGRSPTFHRPGPVRLARGTVLAVALTVAACAGDGSDPAIDAGAERDTQAVAPEPAAEADPDVTLLDRPVPDGSPMPDAARVGGVPPYPGAVVHSTGAAANERFHALQAFTPDTWPKVEAYYDSMLGPGWTRTPATDMSVFERGEDVAITLTPWEGSRLPPEYPAAMREAKTAIGVAWPREER